MEHLCHLNARTIPFILKLLKLFWLTPVQMKKNRPGVVFSVLCPPVLAPALTELLLIETTTLGVRRYAVTRTALVRETTTVETRYGAVAVKTARHHGRPLRCKPEYEDCKRLAGSHRGDWQSVWTLSHSRWRRWPKGKQGGEAVQGLAT